MVLETNPDITDLYHAIVERDELTSVVILNSPEELEEQLVKNGPPPCKIVTNLGHDNKTAKKAAEILKKYGLEKTPVTIITGAPSTPNTKPSLSKLFPELQEILQKPNDVDVEKLSELFSPK